MPAFEPKPNNASMKIASRVNDVSNAEVERISPNEVVNSPPESRRNIPTNEAKPTCVMARYQFAARTVPGWSFSVNTIQYAESDIASHASKKVRALSANTCKLSASNNTLNITPSIRRE